MTNEKKRWEELKGALTHAINGNIHWSEAISCICDASQILKLMTELEEKYPDNSGEEDGSRSKHLEKEMEHIKDELVCVDTRIRSIDNLSDRLESIERLFEELQSSHKSSYRWNLKCTNSR